MWYSLFRILKVISEFQGSSSLHTHKNSFSNDVRCNAWTRSIEHSAVVFLHDEKAQGKLPNNEFASIVRFWNVFLVASQAWYSFHLNRCVQSIFFHYFTYLDRSFLSVVHYNMIHFIWYRHLNLLQFSQVIFISEHLCSVTTPSNIKFVQVDTRQELHWYCMYLRGQLLYVLESKRLTWNFL